LPGIAALREIYDGVVGYSDHTREVTTGALAVIAGASILEKHFTYDAAAKGPDHAASLTTEAFRKYRSYAALSRRYETDPDARRYIDSFLSPAMERAAYRVVSRLREEAGREEKVKRVLEIEQDVRTVSRQSITTVRSLAKGHVLTREDVTFKRPGTGIAPYLLDVAIGKSLSKDVEADMPLMEADLVGQGAAKESQP
jgi:sialic acid synthase SpsE